MITLFLLIAALIFIQLFWFVTDPRPFHQRLKEHFGKKTHKLLALEAFILIPQVISAIYFPLTTPFNNWISAVGLVIFITGFIFSIWSKLTMSKYWGPPEEHDIKRQNELVTWGPFAISRNPIYVGLFLLSLGFGLSLKSALFPLAFLDLGFFYDAVLHEEKVLEKYFGEKFLKYKARVPRFIFI